MTSSYLLLVVATLVIGLGAQGYVNHMLHKYERVPNTNGITGAQAAQQMLQFYGISNIPINRGSAGQDFFDPRTNSITLSPSAFSERSITALATACHEVGHACQFASDYTPMKVRSAIVPVANAASNAWIFLLMIGIFMNLMGLQLLAIAMYAVVVLFQIVTLPVEFNASRRAMAYMEIAGLPGGEQQAAFKVLRACAFTYLAAALTSVLQLLWLLSSRNN